VAHNSLVPAAVIFALTYVVLGVQGIPRIHIDRPSGALLGAVGMVAFGVLFMEYFKVGAPLTLLTITLGILLLR
jgi:hypothetical protein